MNGIDMTEAQLDALIAEQRACLPDWWESETIRDDHAQLRNEFGWLGETRFRWRGNAKRPRARRR
jgi:hypothetical protein